MSTVESESLPNEVDRSLAIEENMRGIVLVVPSFEIRFVGKKVGHADQIPPVRQKFSKKLEFLCRLMKVLDHFAAYDEVVQLGEKRPVGAEQRIELLDRESLFLEHVTNDGSGAAPEIQPPLPATMVFPDVVCDR